MRARGAAAVNEVIRLDPRWAAHNNPRCQGSVWWSNLSARRALTPVNCTERARYRIDRRFFCRRHAALMLLDECAREQGAEA